LGDRRVGLKMARNYSTSGLTYSEILKTLDYRTCVEKHRRLAIDDETFQSTFSVGRPAAPFGGSEDALSRSDLADGFTEFIVGDQTAVRPVP